jgi:hypothetical protein
MAINIVVLKKNPFNECKSILICSNIVVIDANAMEFIHLNVHP